jgi:hypothetical protein
LHRAETAADYERLVERLRCRHTRHRRRSPVVIQFRRAACRAAPRQRPPRARRARRSAGRGKAADPDHPARTAKNCAAGATTPAAARSRSFGKRDDDPHSVDGAAALRKSVVALLRFRECATCSR